MVLQLAAVYPECVEGIVMIEPVRSLTQDSEESRARLSALADAIEASNQEPLRQYVTERFFLPFSDRKLVKGGAGSPSPVTKQSEGKGRNGGMWSGLD